MSGRTNPFRRDRSTADDAGDLRQDNVADAQERYPPLKIDTGARSASTKHVQFASPPAPNTPLSYSYPSSTASSSPESFRYALPSLSPSQSRTTRPEAHQANPFGSEDSDKDSQGTDEGTPQQHGLESKIVEGQSQSSGINWSQPVQDAAGSSNGSAQKQSANATSPPRSDASNTAGSSKQAMDVESFKRMLLTGQPKTSNAADPPISSSASQLTVVGDSSSSNADTASISRQSIFEPVPPVPADTPRTSQELEPDEVENERQRLVGTLTQQARQKPSVPKTRHGKKLVKASMPTDAVPLPTEPAVVQSSAIAGPPPVPEILTRTMSDLNKPLPPAPFNSTFPDIPSDSGDSQSTLASKTRRPPTPPLSRRKSQKQGTQPTLSRSNTAPEIEMQEAFDTFAPEPIAGSSVKKAPPPPPVRRADRNSGSGFTPAQRSGSAEMPQSPAVGSLDSRRTSHESMTRPGLSGVSKGPSRTPSSASRSSLALSGAPPPPPPPRRGRASSKNSMDHKRPLPSQLSGDGGVETSRPESGVPKSTDILADLAALQAEVEALRQRQDRPDS